MIKNYLLSAFRNLWRKKAFSLINILGLAIGMAACLMILQYVNFERNYERFNEDVDHIFRVNKENFRGEESRGKDLYSAHRLGPNLEQDLPEVKKAIRFHPWYGSAVISYKGEEGELVQFNEEDIYFTDSTVFQVFTYPLSYGDPQTALADPFSIVITRKMATKYFGTEIDPMGKVLTVNGGWAEGDFTVKGIIEEAPANTHIVFDFLMPMAALLSNNQYRESSGWGWTNFFTYVQLDPQADPVKLDEKLVELSDKYQTEGQVERNSKYVYHLMPITDIHLYSELEGEPEPANKAQNVYFFTLIAIIILLIAWVNYVNLSTARSMERAREVGIRKAIGAKRSQLVTQFLFESFLINSIAVLIAVGLSFLLLPQLGELFGKPLAVSLQGDAPFWLTALGLFAFGAFISGLYPAFVMSAFKPVTALKSGVMKLGAGGLLRKVLVVTQFAATIALIAGAFAVLKQLNYMRGMDVGMHMDQILVVKGPSIVEDRENIRETIKTFKQELKRLPNIQAAASSASIPGAGHNWGTGMRRLGADVNETRSGSIVWVDYDFFDTYGMELLAGRTFSDDFGTDEEGLVINEAAVTAFGLGSPEQALTERMSIGGDTAKIIGVLKNYGWASLKDDFTPMLLAPSKGSRSYFSFHLQTRNLDQTIAEIEENFRTTFPGNPFNYFFLDDYFDKEYKEDKQFGNVFGLFTLLAVLVACLGLYGLSSFTAMQRTKEIGIRKVLGASTSNIVVLLVKHFFSLVGIASVLGLILAWFGITSWLEEFAFRIDLGVVLFIVPILAVLFLALVTVIGHTLRAASTNPANALKTE